MLSRRCRHDFEIDYPQLLQLLNIQSYGSPAGNIRQLTQLNLKVTYSQTDMTGLEAMPQQGQPVIVFIRTGERLHWTYSTDHALLVVGNDDEYLFVNDPDRKAEEVPIAVPVAILNLPGSNEIITMPLSPLSSSSFFAREAFTSRA